MSLKKSIYRMVVAFDTSVANYVLIYPFWMPPSQTDNSTLIPN